MNRGLALLFVIGRILRQGEPTLAVPSFCGVSYNISCPVVLSVFANMVFWRIAAVRLIWLWGDSYSPAHRNL